MTGPLEALDFWFGPEGSPDYGTFRTQWFTASESFDAEVAACLGPLHARAAAGDLREWLGSPHGALALVILLDQVPRNIFRGTPTAFATDAHARAVADEAVARGHDRAFPPVPRLFFYMPFEHSEDIADQERAVALIGELGLADALDYAVRHRDIVARFGRFPHRNRILGRPSTPEELEFLAQPNSSF